MCVCVVCSRYMSWILSFWTKDVSTKWENSIENPIIIQSAILIVRYIISCRCMTKHFKKEFLKFSFIGYVYECRMHCCTLYILHNDKHKRIVKKGIENSSRCVITQNTLRIPGFKCYSNNESMHIAHDVLSDSNYNNPLYFSICSFNSTK